MSSYSEELGFLYRPRMNYICQIFELTIFGISTLLVMLASYVILKKSTQDMGHYKYFLLNQLMWNFFFNSILTFWHPVLIFNAQNANSATIMAYSNGVFRYDGPYSFYTVFAILFLAIIGMTHSLYFNLTYRVCAVFYHSRFGLLIQEPLWAWRLFFSSLGIAILVLESPAIFLIFYPKDLNILYSNSIKAMPAMKDVIRLEPSTSGCDLPTCGPVSLLIQGGIAVLAILTSICVVFLIYFSRVKYLMTQNMSQTTLNMNRMLMKALIVHNGIIVVLLVIPVMVLYAIALFGNEKCNIILDVIVVVFTCHSLFVTSAMLFFIKPYRKFISGVLWNALQKVGLDKFLQNDQVQIIQQAHSLSWITPS